MNVTVVGAGIVGCAVAHELASRGAQVRVVDPRGVGRGATRASAGMLAPHIEGHIPALHALGVRSLALFDEFIGHVREQSTHPVEYRRSGTLQVAADSDEIDRLRDEAERLAAGGVVHRWLTGSELREAEPSLSDGYQVGLLIGEHGYVAVTALTDALAAAAVSRGVEFLTERVLRIRGSESGAQVVTSAETIDADTVVMCAGSWSPELVPDASPSAAVRPIRGQLLQVQASAPAASQIVWGSGCYVVPWSDGGALIGATVEDVGFDERATASAVRDLLTAATALLPALRDAAFEEVRVGLRPMSADELPIVGPSTTMPRLYYATGHFRNGILLAPLTARLVADALLDDRAAPELEVMRPARFGL